MANIDAFSTKKMQQALRLAQQPLLDGTNSELKPVIARGRGRAAKRSEKLQNASKPATDVNKSFNMFLGCTGASKTVVSSAVPVTANPVFEYSVKFSSDLSENACASFLRKYFANIEQVYLYEESRIYTPNRLRSTDLEYTLYSRSTQALVKLTLTFQGIRKLDLCLKLFEKLFEYINTHFKQPKLEILQKYACCVWNSKAGPLLCIDCQYYSIQKKSVADMVLSCKEIYGDKYCEAVDMLLKGYYIYNQQDKQIYKVDNFGWENGVLRLVNDRNVQSVDVAFAQCHISERMHNFGSQFAMELLSEIKTLISSEHIQPWNIQFGPFMKSPARVLPKETITFGGGIMCSPKQGSWQSEMLENKAVTSVELWCWIILYTIGNEKLAQQLGQNIMKLQSDTGMSIGKPLYFPIQADSKDAYIEALEAIIDNNIQLVVVLTPRSVNKPEPLIRHICCVRKPVPCQIIPAADVALPRKLHETVLVMNAMLGKTLWTVSLPYKNWMICGISIHDSLIDKAKTVGSFVAGFSDDATQWYSKALYLEREFSFHLEKWLIDTLMKYRSTNGVLPSDVVIYHLCTEETKGKIHRYYKSFKMDQCLQELGVDQLKMSVILVQQDIKTYYYKSLDCKNVPSGTIVDDVITNADCRDFFLVSYHAGDDEVTHPTYYKVIMNTCNITPDAIQILTYKLCHLYYKHARIADIPAPCKYAEQLGKLVSEVTHDISSPVLDEYLYYL